MDFRNFMAITISPRRRQCSAQFAYDSDSYIIRKYLNKVSQHYIIVPEFDLQSRLHYHGVVVISDWIKWHKQVHRTLESLCGWIKLDKLKTHLDHLRWLCYIYKHLHETGLNVIIYRRRRGQEEEPLNPESSNSRLNLEHFGFRQEGE